MKFKSFLIFLGILFAGFLIPAFAELSDPGVVQNDAKKPESPVPAFPSEVLEPVRNGLAAMARKDWKQAQAYFFEAHQKAPLHPKALYQLGWLSAKQGNVIPAIFWYKAYLESAPGPSEQSRIEKEIKKLESKVQTVRLKLMEETLQTITDFPAPLTPEEKEAFSAKPGAILIDGTDLGSSGLPPNMDLKKKSSLAALAFAKVSAGELDEAYQFALQNKIWNATRDAFSRYYGQLYAGAGHFEKAEKLLDSMSDVREKDLLLRSLIVQSLSEDRMDASEKYLALLSNSKDQSEMLRLIVYKYVRQLNPEKAEKIFRKTKVESDRTTFYSTLTLGFLKTGALESAREWAKIMLNEVPQTKEGDLDRVFTWTVLGDRKSVEIFFSKNPVMSADSLLQNFFAAIYSQDKGMTLFYLKKINGVNPEARTQKILAKSALACEARKWDVCFDSFRTLTAEVREPWTISLFWRLVRLKEYEAARRLAVSADQRIVAARLLGKLSQIQVVRGDLISASDLMAEAFDGALQARDAVTLGQLADIYQYLKQFQKEEWMRRAKKTLQEVVLAEYFMKIPAAGELREFLQRSESAPFVKIPQATALAASHWGQAALLANSKESS